jgi:hypothetical protein
MPPVLAKKAFSSLRDGLSVKDPKIKTPTAVAMLVVALTMDLAGVFIELIPLIGLAFAVLIPLIALPLFGIWFTLLNVEFLGGKKASIKVLSWLGGTVVEMIPLINLLVPGITMAVFGVIYATRLEDKQREEADKKKKEEESQGGPRPRSSFRVGGPTKIAMPPASAPAEEEYEMA